MSETDAERHTKHEPTAPIQPGPGTTSGGDGGEYEHSKREHQHDREHDRQHDDASPRPSGSDRS